MTTVVIPGAAAAPKLRHSARSRGIHLRLPTHQLGIQCPLRTQMDTATSRSMTAVVIPGAVAYSKPGVTAATNFAIPGVTAAPKLRHSARSRGIHLRLPTHQPGIQCPRRTQMDTATSRSMTAVVIPGAVAYSKPGVTATTNFTIPGVTAAPKLRHSARSRGIHLRLPTHQPGIQCPRRTQMDTATSRSMTAVVIPGAVAYSKPGVTAATNFAIPGVTAAPKLRHSARSRGIHLRQPRHLPKNPVPSAHPDGCCDFAQHPTGNFSCARMPHAAPWLIAEAAGISNPHSPAPHWASLPPAAPGAGLGITGWRPGLCPCG